MKAHGFIASRIRGGGGIAVAVVALSCFVICVAFAVAGGFRREIHEGIRSEAGDILLAPAGFDYLGGGDPVSCSDPLLEELRSGYGISEIRPVVSCGGIVRNGGNIQGVLFKGVGGDSSATLSACVPRRLASMLGLQEGGRLSSWFISDKVRARNFTISGFYDQLAAGEENLTVIVPIQDMQRLCGWGRDSVSAFEIVLSGGPHSRSCLSEAAARIGSAAYVSEGETMFASSVPERWPQVFDWLDLIDYNVLAVLLLMAVVAGFNMISSVLIIMFRNISTIGLLKTLGMPDRRICAVFLRFSSRICLKGMLLGNAFALLFCLIQGLTHAIRLNPVNYFLDFVPVYVNPLVLVLSNLLLYAAVMLFTLLPCLFVSGVDPARTIRRS